METNIHDQIVKYLKAGEKAHARVLLIDTLRQQSHDEQAWLMLAQLVENEAHKRDCLVRALTVNPNNSQARQLLIKLSPSSLISDKPILSRSTASTAPLLSPSPGHSEDTHLLQTLDTVKQSEPFLTSDLSPPAQQPHPQPLTSSGPTVRHTRQPPKWLWLSITAVALGIIGLTLSGLWLTRRLATLAAGTPPTLATSIRVGELATATPRIPTFPPTWTTTPIPPTTTPQPRPTSTPAVSATSVQSIVSPPNQIDHKIAYTQYDGTHRHVYVTDGSSLGIDVSGVGGANAAWLPDGILFVRREQSEQSTNNPSALYRASADGTEVQQILSNFSSYSGPIPSPDGERLAFVTLDQRELRLEVMNIDGAQRVTLHKIALSDASMDIGDWSPDGEQIVFTQIGCVTQGTAPVVTLCDSEIYLINANGTGLRQLTVGVRGAGRPRWSPDGSQILFYVASPDKWTPFWSQLMLMNNDGDNLRPLVLDGYTDINLEVPDWSPDGQQVVFHGMNRQGAAVYIVPVICFSTPKACSWRDTFRLPFDATGVSNLSWKNAPPVTAENNLPPPTIPVVTPLHPLTDTWIPFGSYTGQNTSQTARFSVDQGTLRVEWEYAGPANSKFAVVLGRDLTQDVFILDEWFGSGSGITTFFVVHPGRDYFFIVESLGEWKLDVSFKPFE